MNGIKNCVAVALIVAATACSSAWAAATITGAQIKDGTVQSRDIANGAKGIRGVDVRDQSIGSADIAPGAIKGHQLADGSIGIAELASATVENLRHAQKIDGVVAGGDLTGVFPNPELAPLPGARAFLSSQSIDHMANRYYDLGTEVFDTAGMYEPGTNKMIVKRSGTYAISGVLTFEADPDGVRVVRLTANGVTQAYQNQAGSTSGNVINISTVARLKAGDEIAIAAFQSSGNTLNTVVVTGLGAGYLSAQMVSS